MSQLADSSVTCSEKSVTDFESVVQLINEPRAQVGTGVESVEKEKRGLKRGINVDEETVLIVEKARKNNTTIQNNIEAMCVQSTILSDEIIKQKRR